MATLFHDLPRDPETVAAVRRFCDEQGFPSGCAEKFCRQRRQCRGRWRAEPHVPACVLPPCLSAEVDRRVGDLCVAQEAYHELKLAMAEIRKLPDPEAAAEADHFDPDAVTADDPWGDADGADWA